MKAPTSLINTSFMKKVLTISISGLIATSAYADNYGQKNNQEQNPEPQQNPGLSQGETGQAPDFQEMDTDQDELLVWREIYVVMDPRIVAANLDQEQVFNRYDQDNNDALDEKEFTSFLQGLEQEKLTSAGSRESYDITADTNDRSQTSPGEIAQSDNPGDVQTGANQSVLQRNSRYNQEPYAQASEKSQSMAPNNGNRRDGAAETGGLRSEVARDPMADRTMTERSTEADKPASQQQAMADKRSQELRETPIKSLQDKTVTTAQGEKIGEVTEVAINQNDGTIGLLVESKGLMGIGARSIIAPVDELALSEDEVVWHTDKSERELKKANKYQPDRYVEVSDQYETIDQIRRAGLSQR